MSATSPPVGPVEWGAVIFLGGALDPAVVPPLADLMNSGAVRVLDAAVVHKDAHSAITGTELEDEGAAVTEAFETWTARSSIEKVEPVELDQSLGRE